jgi:hypothetical protein
MECQLSAERPAPTSYRYRSRNRTANSGGKWALDPVSTARVDDFRDPDRELVSGSSNQMEIFR